MYGWEKITSMCGLGCKVFWHPWAQSEKMPYDVVNKDDHDVTDPHDPVTTEPHKPIWSEQITPIVRNKSASVGNIRASGGYEKVASNVTSKPPPARSSISEKRNSMSSSDVNISSISSKALLTDKKTTSGSRMSLDERLEVTQLVSTV